MKQYFKPSSLLFYLLLAILFFFAGIFIAVITEAAKGQGLAGGAIILMYGLVSAGIAFLVSFYLVGLLGHDRIIKLNKILLMIVAILVTLLIYRYQSQQTALNESFQKELKSPGPVTQPADFSFYKTAVKLVKNDHQQRSSNSADMGLGMATPDFYNHNEIAFYSNPNLKKAVREHTPVDKLIFKRTETGIVLSEAPPWFVPAHLKMDYEILKMHLISISSDFFEVVVNETTGRTAYMSRSQLKIDYWPEFLLSVNSVEPVSKEINPVRIKPLSHAAMSSTPYEFLKPLIIKREWIKVELINKDYQSLGKGWIRWQENGQLVITYALLS